jgi:hypothetical protein
LEATTPTQRLNLLASAVNGLDAFNENPKTPDKDGGYRLYTRINVVVCCKGNTITSFSAKTDKDGGNELPFIDGTISLDGGPFTAAPTIRLLPSFLLVVWRGWGRPNLLAEPGMQAVALRTSVNIWHKGEIWLQCNKGRGTYSIKSFFGSQFPSHRLWVNGMRKRNVPQGPFSDLWTPKPGDPTFVK